MSAWRGLGNEKDEMNMIFLREVHVSSVRVGETSETIVDEPIILDTLQLGWVANLGQDF